MKHGAQSTLNKSRPSKKGSVEKSFNQLLEEVFRGEFQAFREYVEQNNLVELDCSYKAINDSKARLLAKALRGSNVTTLILSENQIGDEGAKALGEALPGSNVTSLDLWSNNIGDVGAKALAEALRGSNVTSLNLSDNQIKDAGAKALAKDLSGSNVTWLDFSKNYISSFGAVALAQALRGSNVTTLILSENQIGDVGAKALAEALPGSKVISLPLSWNNITDEGAKALALAVPGSSLLQIYFNDRRLERFLREALALNQQKIVLTPYYAIGLYYLNKTEKDKCYPSEHGQNLFQNPVNELEYAGGIVMNLPLELVENVVSFLPGMNAKLKNGKNRNQNYTALFKQHHKGGLLVNEPESEVSIDAMEIDDNEYARNDRCTIL